MQSPIRQHDLQVDVELEAVGHFVDHWRLVPLVPIDKQLIRAVSKGKYGGLRRTDDAVFTVGISGQSGAGWGEFASDLGNQEEEDVRIFVRKNEI